ncbi:MAG: hypothetical protein K0B07_02785 [DPANN group archaeon]|nr:hypothetical protein [DPANN group archaeon]
MSEQYILLVMPYEAHKPCEIKGALDFISNTGTLGQITDGTIIENNLDLYFPNKKEYKTTRDAFLEIIKNLPETHNSRKNDYHFFKATILDMDIFKKNLSSIQNMYPNIVYRYIVDNGQ